MKYLLTALLLLCSSSLYASSELNEVNDQKLSDIGQTVVSDLLGESLSKSNWSNIVRHVRQIGASNTYLLKFVDPNDSSVYTLAYLADIASVLVVSDASLIRLGDQSNIIKEYEASYVRPLLKEIDQQDVIVMSTEDSADLKKVYVFTDPTCGYCQKLHSELSDYQDQGISIQYLPFPRGGLQGPGYEMLVNTYCSKDRKVGIEFAKMKNMAPFLPDDISEQQLQRCENIVGYYYELGIRLGIQGTPAIFTESGYQLGGYLPALQMSRMQGLR